MTTVQAEAARPDLKPAQREDFMKLGSFSALLAQEEGFPVDEIQRLEDLVDMDPSPLEWAMEQGPRGAPGFHGSVPFEVRSPSGRTQSLGTWA
ncbi:hypothetical protein SRHO_G00186650 [Serrasalmus rhombeus]